MIKTGQIMVQQGLVTPENLDMALSIQKKNRDRALEGRTLFLGIILCKLNLITPVENYYVLKTHEKLVTTITRLAEKDYVSYSRLIEIESEAREQGTPFISYLLEKQVLPKTQLKEVLFELFGIPLRSISDITFDETNQTLLASIVDREQASANGLIPLQLSGDTLTIGITDPDGLLFIRTLDQRFPQYRFHPVFIPFPGFKWFYPILYPEAKALARKAISTPPPKKEGRDTPPIAVNANSPSEAKSFESSPPEAINDPRMELHAVARLFKQYERIRLGRDTQNNHEAYSRRMTHFADFICENYDKISARYGCQTIEFFAHEKDGKPMVMAKPAVVCQKGKEDFI